MNPHLQKQICALTEKVSDQTKSIFSDTFFRKQDVIINALDNVNARKYMDSRCVANKRPLLESGTLGPKGHVQVIVPHLTESYGSNEDPDPEEGDIPQCTLKMFPEEALHCVEWARDKFGAFFTLKPKNLVQQHETPDTGNAKLIKQAIAMAKKAPKHFDDCVVYARRKFEKYFSQNVQQLMHTYPLDAKTKEGKLFWTLPKRPPNAITFDVLNEAHVNAVASMACLRAKVFGIEMPKNPRSSKVKQTIALKALDVKVPAFVPSDEKAKAI